MHEIKVSGTFPETLLSHIIEMAHGKCSLTKEAISQIAGGDEAQAKLLAGLLSLNESIEIQKKQLRISNEELSNSLQMLRSTQEQLIQASKLSSLGTMASGMCHELNNPLAGIMGFSELLLDMQLPVQKQKECLTRIVDLSLRMQKTIDHLRVFARDGRCSNWEHMDINTPVRAAFQLLGTRLKNENITVIIDCAENLTFSGNKNQIQSVFQSLITNSQDAFSEIVDTRSKNISITITRNQENIAIVYRDNAGGMPPEILSRIFEPFFTTKEVGSGTGLGLSVSHGIIRQHKGNMNAQSALGDGATFNIVLPYQEKIK